MSLTRPTIALAIAAIAVLPGCGGDGDGGPEKRAAPAAQQGLSRTRYVARADAICTDAVRQTRRLGHRFLTAGTRSGAGSALLLTTKKLVIPGIEIRERQARRLRRLGPPPDRTLADYLQLFDPLAVLSRMRAEAGRAENVGRSQALERLMLKLGNEQRLAAIRAGLRACGVDFVRAAFPGSRE
jgi:hypothetical protein